MEYKNDKLTLDALPDDCLDCIFSRIDDLKSEIQVSRVCANFKEICARMWRRDANYHCLCIEQWQAHDLSTDDFAYLLQNVRTAVRTIRLICFLLHDFIRYVRDDMQIEYFPNVYSFETENVMDSYASEKDVLSLIQLLPNVQILKLTQALSGRHLKLCTQLQELHLYHDYEKKYELQNQYLPEIFENLTQLRLLDIRSYEMSFLDISAIDKCHQLQVLKLNLNVLKPVLDKVLALPCLRSLKVILDLVIDVSRIDSVDSYDCKIYETREFYHILQKMADKITGIAVDNYFLPLKPHWDDNLRIFESRKLEKFSFCNYEYSDDMLDKYANMPELRLLCCRNWVHLTNETVLKFVESCTKLEHLDVTYCNRINENFLHGAVSALRAQGKRKPTLTIYYAMTAIEDNIEKHPAYADWTSLMILSTDFPPDSDKGLSYVQRGYEFEFE